MNGNCSVTAHLATVNSETRDVPAAAAENGFLQKLLRRQAAELKDLAEASRGREVHPDGGIATLQKKSFQQTDEPVRENLCWV